ncbi:MAG: excalibur calcium-binding domain-containing protein [Proteobacteria bacterium]|nr:excalibur calcium-binding domain-containing protein [Pseudomonadota bacterium]
MAFTNPIRQRLSARAFDVIPGGKRDRRPRPDLDSIERRYRTRKMRRLAFRFTVGRAGLAVLTAAAIVGSFYAATSQSDWNRRTILKHIAAAPNCDAARAVGLAPARRGEPGYYDKHDRDKDGIACEVWPRR